MKSLGLLVVFGLTVGCGNWKAVTHPNARQPHFDKMSGRTWTYKRTICSVSGEKVKYPKVDVGLHKETMHVSQSHVTTTYFFKCSDGAHTYTTVGYYRLNSGNIHITIQSESGIEDLKNKCGVKVDDGLIGSTFSNKYNVVDNQLHLSHVTDGGEGCPAGETQTEVYE